MRFEVNLNGERMCIAGMNFGVLTTTLTWIRRDSANPHVKARHAGELAECGYAEISIGALSTAGYEPSGQDEILNWVRRELNIGDELVIRVLPPGDSDTPSKRTNRQSVVPRTDV